MAVDEHGVAKPLPPLDPAIRRLQEENQRLKRAIEELTLLNELAREIGASRNTQEIMQTIIHRSLRAVNAEQGLITLVKPQANEPMKTLVRGMATSSAHQPFHLNQSLLGWMFRNKKPLLINDPRHDQRFQGVLWDESIRGQTLLRVSAGECMRRANILLYESTDIEKFATAFYAILDTHPQGPSGLQQLSYSNAGHNPPLLFSGNNSPQPLITGGIMLGIMKGMTFEDEVISFNPGDLLVIYSDGVSEALNVNDEEFGEERLIAVVRDNWGSCAEELIEKIIKAVKLYAGQVPQSDDITLVVVRRA